jgi:hypothetical protein
MSSIRYDSIGADYASTRREDSKQLPAAPHQTEQRSILRCALPDLPALLLAEALPDQRVRVAA